MQLLPMIQMREVVRPMLPMLPILPPTHLCAPCAPYRKLCMGCPWQWPPSPGTSLQLPVLPAACWAPPGMAPFPNAAQLQPQQVGGHMGCRAAWAAQAAWHSCSAQHSLCLSR